MTLHVMESHAPFMKVRVKQDSILWRVRKLISTRNYLRRKSELPASQRCLIGVGSALDHLHQLSSLAPQYKGLDEVVLGNTIILFLILIVFLCWY